MHTSARPFQVVFSLIIVVKASESVQVKTGEPPDQLNFKADAMMTTELVETSSLNMNTKLKVC